MNLVERLHAARVKDKTKDAPVIIGTASVIRTGDAGLQLQSKAFARWGRPNARLWVRREHLHPTCKLGRPGDRDLLVLRSGALRALGFAS